MESCAPVPPRRPTLSCLAAVRAFFMPVLLVIGGFFGPLEAWAAPAYVVTVSTDTTNGSPGNCTDQSLSGARPDVNCSLRDALATAVANGASITFSAAIFSTAQTISLNDGPLYLPSNTTITGPTTGTAPSISTPVGVSGAEPVIYVDTGVTDAAISNLEIGTNGSSIDLNGRYYGILYCDGSLSLTNVSISGGGTTYSGAGIENQSNGTMTILNSTISGNGTQSLDLNYQNVSSGAGVYNNGVMKMTNSAVTGNGSTGGTAGIVNSADMTIVNSTIVNNIAYLGQFSVISAVAGISNTGTLTVLNSIVSNNTGQLLVDSAIDNSQYDTFESDCSGSGCPSNGVDGNIVGASTSISPGAPAICGGVLANIPEGLISDQRGVPRTTTYSTPSGDVTCVDSGAIQTHYSLAFITEPPSSVAQNAYFGAVVQLDESGLPSTLPYGLSIFLGLAPGGSGTLTNGIFTGTGVGSSAGFANLLVNAPGTGDMLVASLPITGTPPPYPLVAPVSITATSSAFDVTSSSYVQATVSTSPVGIPFTVDSNAYTSAVTLGGWVSGSQHIIATTSPQTMNGEQFVFKSWSDGGAISHTIAAGSAPGYTATFTAGVTLEVNTAADDATGTAANCGAGSHSSCTLRDALAAAALAGGGTVTFDPTVFAAAQPVSARTITLGSAGTLNIPPYTNIVGPTTGSGATLIQLVTVNGNNQFTVFAVGNGGSGVFTLSGLKITGGTLSSGNGAGISNFGGLAILNCIISGNSASGGGGAIYNGLYAAMEVTNSVISGNQGTGIFNSDGGAYVTGSTIFGNTGDGITSQADSSNAELTVANSTISGNSGAGINAIGGQLPGTLAVTNSTISGNGNGIEEYQQTPSFQFGLYFASVAVTDSIIAGNTATGGSDVSCNSAIPIICPANGVDGNIVGVAPMLAPLGNYGGPTPTMPPLPGSSAICTGVIGDVPGGTTTDQRGFPRTTTYGSNPPCVDSGAVQTHYALAFNTEPPAIVPPNTNFTAAVQLSENGNPFPVSGITVPLTLGAGSTGSLSGGSAATSTTGIATYSTLQVNANCYGDTLVAMLPLTASGITPLATTSATSTAFDVIQPGSPVAEPIISPPTGTYTSPQSVTITDTTPGAIIYYTTNGTTPSLSSPVFNPASPISVTSTQTIKALAVASNYAPSPEAAATYTIAALAPVISPPTDFYFPPISVTITDATPNAVIHYTTDGTTPTPTSPVYGGTFTVTSPERVRAIATAPNLAPSALTNANFDVMSAAAEPIISLPSGTYTGTQMVMITDATPGAIIYYTTNGMTPSRSSAVYSSASPIMVTSSQTIKALAVATGYATSPEAVARYAITP